MSDQSTTQLGAASAIDDDDVMLVIEDGVARKVTVADLRESMVPEPVSSVGDKLTKWTFCK